MAKILLVEDDETISATVKDVLLKERHTIDQAFDGNSALDYISAYDYDIIVLDINLPGVDGFEICHQVREAGKNCGILMLTGQDQVSEKSRALDLGADDYLVKPFAWQELNSRIRALLRRVSGATARQTIAVHNVKLDLTARKIWRDDVELHLTPKEFALLEFMMRHKGQVLNAETLISRVWPADGETSVEMVRSHIKNIRKKLHVEGQKSIMRTVHKIGYVVDDTVDGA